MWSVVVVIVVVIIIIITIIYTKINWSKNKFYFWPQLSVCYRGKQRVNSTEERVR